MCNFVIISIVIDFFLEGISIIIDEKQEINVYSGTFPICILVFKWDNYNKVQLLPKKIVIPTNSLSIQAGVNKIQFKKVRIAP